MIQRLMAKKKMRVLNLDANPRSCSYSYPRRLFCLLFFDDETHRRSHVFKGVGSNTNQCFIANGGGWVWCFYEIVDRQHPAES